MQSLGNSLPGVGFRPPPPADSVVEAAVAAKKAATGPALPTAIAPEQATKAGILANLNASFVAMGGGADVHSTHIPSPMPPHGTGVVLDGSKTVLINHLPACRQGDTVTEPLGPPNKIVLGCPTVMIGGRKCVFLRTFDVRIVQKRGLTAPFFSSIIKTDV